MTISIITLFPEMFEGPFSYSIIKNAVKKGFIKINFINIRDFGIGKHKIVDDKPYGGGKGMILRADVLYEAIEHARKSFKKTKNTSCKVVLLDPSGSRYNQQKARELSFLDHIVIVCGHYEGFDRRIKKFIDEEISIGDYILTGGEIPAMTIVDSVTRLIRGVLPENVTEIESFSSQDGQFMLEYPQYTRPEKFKNLRVPQVLLSGNHREIESWRKKQSAKITKGKRPDLLKRGS